MTVKQLLAFLVGLPEPQGDCKITVSDDGAVTITYDGWRQTYRPYQEEAHAKAPPNEGRTTRE